jgi:hypothetical protein
MCQGVLLVTDFNKVWEGGGWGAKCDSKAFGNYFVVCRRQKGKIDIYTWSDQAKNGQGVINIP